MIDSGLSVPLLPAAWFHLRQFFWFNVWPVIVGFTTILCYQIYMHRAGGYTEQNAGVRFVFRRFHAGAVRLDDNRSHRAHDPALWLRRGASKRGGFAALRRHGSAPYAVSNSFPES